MEKKALKDDKFWHLRTVDEVFTEVKSSKEGLSESEANERLEIYGENKLSSEKSLQWFKVLLDKLNSILIYVLFGSSLIAFFSKEYLEFFVIILIILMTVLLGFFQEYKADKTVKALNKLTAKKVLVRREGRDMEILSEELVPGDVVYLKRGDIVPADMRLFEVSGLEVNESIITGESVFRAKSTSHITEENIELGDMTNIAFSSTFVTAGSGIGLVVETGKKTFIGKISQSLEQIKNQKSPIQKKIDLMSKKISYIVLFMVALIFSILVFRGEPVLDALLIVGAVAISGIPESFPLALTLTLSNGIKKMAKQNAIVKDLESVETLGTTTVICTDKTGTLTENKMRVTKLYLPEVGLYDAKGSGYEPFNRFYLTGEEVKKTDLHAHKSFFETAVLCNDSEIKYEQNVWRLVGEPTEGALLALSRSTDIDDNLLREDYKRHFVLPFDPVNKYMISVNKEMEDGNHYNFYLKGASEVVLSMCDFYRSKDGKSKRLQEDFKKNIEKEMEALNRKGLRVLSLASKVVRGSKSKEDESFFRNNLKDHYVFEGFVGIEDPIRKEVYSAVEHCHDSGIKLVMITGDHKLIAKSIGERLGFLKKGSSMVLSGYEIDRLSDEDLDSMISNVGIFARTTPEHKLRIVNSLQRNGEIVAMTGDGVNDAPALKKADIGVSMGKNGTEVAREASNMVLTDDNFATIVKAVREGRTIYSNIRRFIYYLLTGNFTEVSLIFASIVVGFPIPLTALMILFVNLVTSTIPALSLSIEPTHDKVMRQKPRNPKERLLSGYILTKILTTVPLLLVGTLGIFAWEYVVLSEGISRAMTMTFVTLILFELFHAFNARSLHTTIFDSGFFSNVSLFAAVLISLLLTFWAVYSPSANEIFGTLPLETMDWLVILIISSGVVFFTEIIKFAVKSEFDEQKNLQGKDIVLE